MNLFFVEIGDVSRRHLLDICWNFGWLFVLDIWNCLKGSTFSFPCIFTSDCAFRVLFKMWLPLHSDVFLLSATDSLLKFGSNDFTCSPPVFGLLVDYFSTLSWRWVILLLYFVTTLLILSVAKVSRVSFENDESIDPNTSWSDEFLCSGLVL